jgi:hypothetical protein
LSTHLLSEVEIVDGPALAFGPFPLDIKHRNAKHIGADLLEMDVQMTKDGAVALGG